MHGEPMVNDHKSRILKMQKKLYAFVILSSCYYRICEMAIDVKHQFSGGYPFLKNVDVKPIYVVL